ncbi:PAS domain-containing sensor histidine kinase [Flexithrix dorotheae]|uniref:PAS domain-containing sensor histidine kinase n=1 Tax=Flexithrix dorotheae TaxID=70993 RepID=UPI00037ECC14|nr:PAS domain-containing protein [Flexithrix dorotheae]
MHTQLQIFKEIIEPILILDKEGYIIFANPSFENLSGYSYSALSGKSIKILFPDTSGNNAHTSIFSAISNFTPIKLGKEQPLYLLKKDLEKIPVGISLSVIETENAKVLIALFSEKTEVITQEQLKRANSFYLSLIEHNEDHIFQLDKDLNIRYINHVAPGLKREEVLGTSLLPLLPDEATKIRVKNILQNSFKTGKPDSYEINFNSPNGIIRYDTTVTPVVKNGNVEAVNLISRDFTNEYKLKSKILEHQRFIENLDNYSLNGVYIYNIQKGINTYINKRYEEILGYSLQEINDMSPEEFFALFHPDDAQAISDHMKEVSNLKKGEFSELEYRFKAKNGNWVWCLSRDAGFDFDEEGNVISFIGTFIDLSRQKKIEESLKAKNKEIESFVYIASHDLKSPLNSVKQIFNHILGRYALDPTVEEFMGIALRSVDRLRELVSNLLDYSLIEKKYQLEQVDLQHLIQIVSTDLRSLLEENKAVLDYGALPKIPAYRVPIRQLIQNLISNGIKYHRENVTPKISISCSEKETHYLFKVRDNGIGIEEKDFQKIFVPFSRLENERNAHGNGLGLANCKKIIELHQGKIWVESTLQKGSTFYFTIRKFLSA